MVNPESDTDRIARLEAELARVRAERDRYKESVSALLRDSPVFEMPTDEELQQCETGPFGEPMADILAEYRKKLGTT